MEAVLLEEEVWVGEDKEVDAEELKEVLTD